MGEGKKTDARKRTQWGTGIGKRRERGRMGKG